MSRGRVPQDKLSDAFNGSCEGDSFLPRPEEDLFFPAPGCLLSCSVDLLPFPMSLYYVPIFSSSLVHLHCHQKSPFPGDPGPHLFSSTLRSAQKSPRVGTNSPVSVASAGSMLSCSAKSSKCENHYNLSILSRVLAAVFLLLHTVASSSQVLCCM